MPQDEIRKQVEYIRKLEKEIDNKIQQGIEKVFNDALSYIKSIHDREMSQAEKPSKSGLTSFNSACDYFIKGNKINYCHRAMYDKQFKCDFLINRKECKYEVEK